MDGPLELEFPDDVRGPVAGFVVISDGGAPDAEARELARALTTAGVAVALPDLRAVAEEEPTDDEALGALESAARALGEDERVDADRVGVLGAGRGGTLAFLLGCRSRRLGAVVDVAGPIVYPELSRARPTQPLEMALNLDAPLLALFGAEDPATSPADVEALREACARGFKYAEIEVFPAPAGFFHAGRPGYHAASAERAWARILEFLGEHFELEPPASSESTLP